MPAHSRVDARTDPQDEADHGQGEHGSHDEDGSHGGGDQFWHGTHDPNSGPGLQAGSHRSRTVWNPEDAMTHQQPMGTTNTTPSNTLPGLAGLGFKNHEPSAHVDKQRESDEPVIPTGPKQRPLVTGSTTARALYLIVSGARVTVVKSPPGGGKTESIVTIAAHLANRLNVDVSVGTATREQAIGLSHRMIEQVDPERVMVRMANVDPTLLPRGVITQKPKQPGNFGKGMVTIRTVASLKQSRQDPGAQRVLIVDEAYQSTFSSVAAAGQFFAQIVLVGDPGQIGPVITTDTSAYEGLSHPPHHPSPLVFANHESAEVLSIDRTFRLGQETVDAIAPLYDFPFTSARPKRTLTTQRGRVLAEIEHVQHPKVDRSDDTDLMWAVARRAADLVGCIQENEDREGNVTERVLDQSDVAVVAALNSQVSTIKGMLSSLHMDEVDVGTADRLQGGEWAAVVALDPMCGGQAAEHNLSLGRLCVMASRHTTHLSWVHDGAWEADLPVRGGSRQVQLARQVRESFMRNSAA